MLSTSAICYFRLRLARSPCSSFSNALDSLVYHAFEFISGNFRESFAHLDNCLVEQAPLDGVLNELGKGFGFCHSVRSGQAYIDAGRSVRLKLSMPAIGHRVMIKGLTKEELRNALAGPIVSDEERERRHPHLAYMRAAADAEFKRLQAEGILDADGNLVRPDYFPADMLPGSETEC